MTGEHLRHVGARSRVRLLPLWRIDPDDPHVVRLEQERHGLADGPSGFLVAVVAADDPLEARRRGALVRQDENGTAGMHDQILDEIELDAVLALAIDLAGDHQVGGPRRFADAFGDHRRDRSDFQPLRAEAIARHRAVELRFHRLRLVLEMAGQAVIDLGDHIGSDRRIDGGRRDDIDARDMRTVIARQSGRRARRVSSRSSSLSETRIVLYAIYITAPTCQGTNSLSP